MVTPADTFEADVAAGSPRSAPASPARTIDAGGLLLLPGGVDTHCHIEQLQPGGRADEENFAWNPARLFGFTRARAQSPPARLPTSCGRVQAEPGSGHLLARGPYNLIRSAGRAPDDFDASAHLV